MNLTRKALKNQFFNDKIEEYLDSNSKSGGNNDITSIKQNLNKEDYKINDKTKEESFKNDKIDKYENKLKGETISTIRQEINHKYKNIHIKPNQEMVEAEI